jgi:tetratricopeptide (TPR) repeat protein
VVDLATLAAFALVDLKRPEEARMALAPLGDSASATFARARVADRAGDFANAIAICESLLVVKPDLGPALNLAGYLLADSGQRLEVAGKYLQRARELSPGDPAGRFSGFVAQATRDGVPSAGGRFAPHRRNPAPPRHGVARRRCARTARRDARRVLALALAHRADALRPVYALIGDAGPDRSPALRFHR